MKPYLPIVLLAGLCLTACADNTPSGKIVQARHAHFKEISKADKGIDDELKNDQPDLGTIKADAQTIAGLAPQVKTWFPAGTGPQDGKRTDAKAEIWTQPAAFQQAAARLEDGAAKLNAAAQAGNLADIRAAAKNLGGACKNCHDKFKGD